MGRRHSAASRAPRAVTKKRQEPVDALSVHLHTITQPLPAALLGHAFRARWGATARLAPIHQINASALPDMVWKITVCLARLGRIPQRTTTIAWIAQSTLTQ